MKYTFFLTFMLFVAGTSGTITYYPFMKGDIYSWNVDMIQMNQKANSSFWQMQKFDNGTDIELEFVKSITENFTGEWGDMIEMSIGGQPQNVRGSGPTLTYTLSYMDCKENMCVNHDTGISFPLIIPTEFELDNGTILNFADYHRYQGLTVKEEGGMVQIIRSSSFENTTMVVYPKDGVVYSLKGNYTFDAEYEEEPTIRFEYSLNVITLPYISEPVQEGNTNSSVLAFPPIVLTLAGTIGYRRRESRKSHNTDEHHPTNLSIRA